MPRNKKKSGKNSRVNGKGTISTSTNIENVRRTTPVTIVPMALFPSWDCKMTQGMHFRFACTGTASGLGQPVTVLDIFGLLAMSLLSAVAPTTFYGIIDAFKINRIRLVDTNGAASSITWNPTAFSRVKQIQADGNASTNPTIIETRPPRLSTWSFWQDAGSSGTIFSIVGANTLVIDLHLSVSINGVGNSGVITNTSTTGVQGTIYFFPLDGPGVAPVFPSACPSAFRAN